MSKKRKKNTQQNKKSLIILAAILAVGAYFITSDFGRFYNIMVVMIGFGTVIFVHELGHFMAARAVGIKVEAFSLGLGPIIMALQKVPTGVRVRLLPILFGGKADDEPGGFVIAGRGQTNGQKRAEHEGESTGREGESVGQEGELVGRYDQTEYRLCLIPFGGFVKMLGQEDIAADKPSDDPRAFGNKTIWQRAIVISAGVFMNLITAAVVFMIVFAKGVDLVPAVVGDVMPYTPAAQAGLRPGDEVVAIDGKEDISFQDLMIAAAFADEGEKVALTVRHGGDPAGMVETIHVEPRRSPNEQGDIGLKVFGIGRPSTLEIPAINDVRVVAELKKIGFEPGDRIVAVNGQAVSHYGQLSEVLYPLPGRATGEAVTVTVERQCRQEQQGYQDQQGHQCSSGQVVHQTIDIPMLPASIGPKGVRSRVLGMVSRLKVSDIDPNSPASQAGLRLDDIIVRIGPLNNPTLTELQDYGEKHVDESVTVWVERNEGETTVEKQLSVVPYRERQSLLSRLFGKSSVRIGFFAGHEVENTTVAHVDARAIKEFESLGSLPRGARITAVGGSAVNNWPEIIDRLVENKGREVRLSYRCGDEQVEQGLVLTAPDENGWIGLAYRPNLGGLLEVPLKPLTKQFKGDSWLQNLRMGTDMTYSFIAQTYLMIKGMVQGTVGVKAASGPVGILKMSYSVVSERPITYYAYFLAMINVCIAVFNFLPLPILDGGHIMFLLLEKIKGSPISIRVQEITTYTGLILILGLFLFITFHDIMRIATGQM